MRYTTVRILLVKQNNSKWIARKSFPLCAFKREFIKESFFKTKLLINNLVNKPFYYLARRAFLLEATMGRQFFPSFEPKAEVLYTSERGDKVLSSPRLVATMKEGPSLATLAAIKVEEPKPHTPRNPQATRNPQSTSPKGAIVFEIHESHYAACPSVAKVESLATKDANFAKTLPTYKAPLSASANVHPSIGRARRERAGYQPSADLAREKRDSK